VKSSTRNINNDMISQLKSSNGNPHNNIMKINENISKKYGDKVKNGDIEINRTFNSASNSFDFEIKENLTNYIHMEINQQCYDKTIKNYKKLLSNVKSLFKKNKELQELEFNDVEMVTNLDLFVNELNDNDDFKLFVKKKETLFSKKKKLARSLLKVFSLKRVILQDRRFSDVFWKYLHYMYISYNKYNNINDDKIKQLTDKLNEPKKQANALGLNVNGSTNNMINDIVAQLKSSGGNPLNNIMKITENISKKYGGKVKNGDIEVNKIFNSVTDNLNLKDMDFSSIFKNMASQMNKAKEKKEEKPVIIDEQFNTDMVPLGKLDDIKPNAGLGKMLNVANTMMSKLSSLENKDGDVKEEDLKNDLTDMLKMFNNDK
jgi:hypothetical protein